MPDCLRLLTVTAGVWGGAARRAVDVVDVGAALARGGVEDLAAWAVHVLPRSPVRRGGRARVGEVLTTARGLEVALSARHEVVEVVAAGGVEPCSDEDFLFVSLLNV